MYLYLQRKICLFVQQAKHAFNIYKYIVLWNRQFCSISVEFNYFSNEAFETPFLGSLSSYRTILFNLINYMYLHVLFVDCYFHMWKLTMTKLIHRFGFVISFFGESSRFEEIKRWEKNHRHRKVFWYARDSENISCITWLDRVLLLLLLLLLFTFDLKVYCVHYN